MKRFFYQIFCGIAFFLLIPIVVTLLIQGTGTDSAENLSFMPSTEEQEGELNEDFLRGIVANEISMDTEPEAIKAQAVIARTNCLRAMERGESLPEGLTKGEMVRLWGQENFSERYSLLESSIEATKGVSMVYNGSYIQADFHKISAGYTRDAAEVYGNEDFPYLKSIDSRMDIIGEDFLKVIFYTPNELIAKGGELFTDETKAAAAEMSASGFMEKISISKRDKAGYVTEVVIDGKPHSGEEARLLYGWNSSNFSLKEVDGEIALRRKGLGMD